MMRIPQGGKVSFLPEQGRRMEKAKEKFLNALSYCTVLTIAFSFLAFASMGGYLYGSAETARSYDAVFKEFIDNVEARQVFYFHGYKVVPKEKVVVVKVKPQKLAELAESREAGLDKDMDQVVSNQAAESGQRVKASASSKTITRSALPPF
jgi:hypothetical protein